MSHALLIRPIERARHSDPNHALDPTTKQSDMIPFHSMREVREGEGGGLEIKSDILIWGGLKKIMIMEFSIKGLDPPSQHP